MPLLYLKDRKSWVKNDLLSPNLSFVNIPIFIYIFTFRIASNNADVGLSGVKLVKSTVDFITQKNINFENKHAYLKSADVFDSQRWNEDK